MRVHLLFFAILFFASVVLARNARNRRDTNVTTVAPSTGFTVITNNGTDVTGDKCDGINCGNSIFSQPLKMMSEIIKSILVDIKDTLSKLLKVLESTGNLIVRAIMQPFVMILKMGIGMIKRMMQIFDSILFKN